MIAGRGQAFLSSLLSIDSPARFIGLRAQKNLPVEKSQLRGGKLVTGYTGERRGGDKAIKIFFLWQRADPIYCFVSSIKLIRY